MRSIGYIIFSLLSMVPSGIHAQSISIAKYADNRKAAISFTFDDGLKEQLEGTKRSVYLRESPKMMEEPRIEIVR